jgi:hypothetical protein
VKARSFTFSGRQPRKRVRLSASRTAIISFPYFDLTKKATTMTPSASANALAANNAARVSSD